MTGGGGDEVARSRRRRSPRSGTRRRRRASRRRSGSAPRSASPVSAGADRYEHDDQHVPSASGRGRAGRAGRSSAGRAQCRSSRTSSTGCASATLGDRARSRRRTGGPARRRGRRARRAPAARARRRAGARAGPARRRRSPKRRSTVAGSTPASDVVERPRRTAGRARTAPPSTCRRARRAPAAWTWRANSVSSRVLPAPASPGTRTTWRAPAAAVVHASSSDAAHGRRGRRAGSSRQASAAAAAGAGRRRGARRSGRAPPPRCVGPIVNPDHPRLLGRAGRKGATGHAPDRRRVLTFDLHQRTRLEIAMTTHRDRADLLTTRCCAGFDERAPEYDRDNRFFNEDFEELRAARLPAGVGARRASAAPASNLAEINRLQRRIAYVAPATAVAVNMHHYFVGLCADLHRAGDPSGDWVLRQAADGHVFAAGHGEAGNDIPVLLSSSQRRRGSTAAGRSPATRSSAACRRCGPTSASTRMDTSDPANPQVVHGFLAPRRHRATASRRRGTRSACGRRRRNDTILDRAFVPDEAIDPGLPGRLRRRRHVPRRAVRLGAARLRRRVLGDRPAGVRRDGRPGAPAHVDRADPLDGVPPRGAAPGRRDAHPPRGDERPPRPGLRRLGRRRRPRHGLADQDRRLQVRRRDPGVGGRRHAPSTSPAAPASSSAAASSSCSATPGSAASTPATRCSPTSWSAS